MNPRKILLISAVFIFAAYSASAQVSVGNNQKPVEGALLQLKTSEVTGDAANATKGLEYPRVNLSVRTELYPMFGSTGNETGGYDINKAALKLSHTGLTVYNLTQSANWNEGLYVWNGERWNLASTLPGTKDGQFMEWNGDKWILASHDSINPIKRLVIPLDNMIMTTEGVVYVGEIEFSEPAPVDIDDFTLVSIIPVVVSNSAHPNFVAENFYFSTASRRASQNSNRVIWKMRIHNDNTVEATNLNAEVQAVYINYTSTGGTFAADGIIKRSKYMGY
jgi:hypothetical protein